MNAKAVLTQGRYNCEARIPVLLSYTQVLSERRRCSHIQELVGIYSEVLSQMWDIVPFQGFKILTHTYTCVSELSVGPISSTQPNPPNDRTNAAQAIVKIWTQDPTQPNPWPSVSMNSVNVNIFDFWVSVISEPRPNPPKIKNLDPTQSNPT